MGNADNPTGVPHHDSILVRPDDRRGYALRPNVSIQGYMLRSATSLNLDPPVLYLDASYRPSSELRSFIEEQQRLSYSYRTDDAALRTTLPVVQADRKILIVGDSVAFGVGGDDEATLASFLQDRLQFEYRVVNAGVGGYQARQAIETAIVHAEEEGGYDWLIYLTSQNDFIEGDADSTNIARTVLEELAPLRDRFPRGIVLMVMPYMEYSLNDILGQYGWTGGAFDQSEALFEQLPMMTERLGIAYIDLAEMVNGFAVKSGSVFARLALWVDHCHMSPTANRWAAEKLEKLIRR